MSTHSITETITNMLPGHHTKQWDHSDIPDLSGKVYIVTGGSAGIGYGIVTALMDKNPKKVMFLSSREDRAMEKLHALDAPPERVEWVQCDLQDLKEVDRVSLELRKKCEDLGRLDGVSVAFFLEVWWGYMC